MKRFEKQEKAFKYFKNSYKCKMGGTQTILLPNGNQKFFDDREYYQGRGEKYNASINHDELGVIKVTKKDYSLFLKRLKESEENRIISLSLEKEKITRIQKAKEMGVYSIVGNGELFNVELSDEEYYGKFFDAERLAKTLNISHTDAELLNSEGKTYVFAKELNTSELIELYHPSLSCNGLSIQFNFCSEERFLEFTREREAWVSAPYSSELGQTSAPNHFVC